MAEFTLLECLLNHVLNHVLKHILNHFLNHLMNHVLAQVVGHGGIHGVGAEAVRENRERGPRSGCEPHTGRRGGLFKSRFVSFISQFGYMGDPTRGYKRGAPHGSTRGTRLRTPHGATWGCYSKTWGLFKSTFAKEFPRS